MNAYTFEQLLAHVQAKKWQRQQETAIRLLEQAVALCSGAFLAGALAAHGSGTARNRLRVRFIDVVSEVARQCEQERDWCCALICYRRDLEADDLTEDFYQKVMRALRGLGKRVQAVDTYHRCKRHLFVSLNIT